MYIIYFLNNAENYVFDPERSNKSGYARTQFTLWAGRELIRKYPDYNISVNDSPSTHITETDDIENEIEIMDFAQGLYARAPWDLWTNKKNVTKSFTMNYEMSWQKR